ncbi:MAG: hypothetical protein OXR68_01010 [Alphaproteobacteria bacterium]|nr:hypothetical protein [Alphaproteobacteria bacterium]MDD9919190.1 hypothetical protein [Alphaproteobacteria bacterium]
MNKKIILSVVAGLAIVAGGYAVWNSQNGNGMAFITPEPEKQPKPAMENESMFGQLKSSATGAMEAASDMAGEAAETASHMTQEAMEAIEPAADNAMQKMEGAMDSMESSLEELGN